MKNVIKMQKLSYYNSKFFLRDIIGIVKTVQNPRTVEKDTLEKVVP